MKTKSFFSLIAAALVAVACQPKGPAFEPSFEVNGASLKDGKIAVEAAGANAKLAVASNVSWAVDASEDWVVVTPAKADITDKTLKTTEVTVAVSANEAYEPRQATLTLSATDVNLPSIVVTINQAAAVKPEAVFQVLDSDLKDVTSLDVAAAAGNASVIVNANVSWTASADAAWCTIEPANATIEGYEETPTAVTLSFEANTVTEGRSCNVTFTPAEGEPVVVAINQAADVPFTVDVILESVSEYVGQAVAQYPDATCRITIMENPTKTVAEGYYGVWKSAAWEQSELDDPMELLLEYGNKMEADELDGLNGVEGADPCEWIWSSLNPDTEYVFVAGFVAEDGSVYTGYSKSTTDKDEQGGGDKAPADLLGNWICPTATDRWGEDTFTNWTMTLTEVANGVEIAGFDAGMEAIAAANKLTLSKPVAKWSDADKTLTIADSTPTGLAASGNNIVWRGHADGYYTSTVYTYDATAHTLSLSVDGFMAVAGTSAYSGFDAPLVFYKEGHVPSSVKACGSVNKSVARAAVKDIKAAKAGHVSAKAVLR